MFQIAYEMMFSPIVCEMMSILMQTNIGIFAVITGNHPSAEFVWNMTSVVLPNPTK